MNIAVVSSLFSVLLVVQQRDGIDCCPIAEREQEKDDYPSFVQCIS